MHMLHASTCTHIHAHIYTHPCMHPAVRVRACIYTTLGLDNRRWRKALSPKQVLYFYGESNRRRDKFNKMILSFNI